MSALKLFTFGVVGVSQTADGDERIHQVYGNVAHQMDEYARRMACSIFREHFPKAEILIASVTPQSDALINQMLEQIKAT